MVNQDIADSRVSWIDKQKDPTNHNKGKENHHRLFGHAYLSFLTRKPVIVGHFWLWLKASHTSCPVLNTLFHCIPSIWVFSCILGSSNAKSSNLYHHSSTADCSFLSFAVSLQSSASAAGCCFEETGKIEEEGKDREKLLFDVRRWLKAFVVLEPQFSLCSLKTNNPPGMGRHPRTSDIMESSLVTTEKRLEHNDRKRVMLVCSLQSALPAWNVFVLQSEIKVELFSLYYLALY